MKRVLIHLPEELYAGVADLARTKRTTRGKVILDAIQAYVSHGRVGAGAADAFGLWSGQASATRTYTESIRSEWEDEPR
jgi:metal-responsive CopG/Arc/MetJ family transcriptional regulator